MRNFDTYSGLLRTWSEVHKDWLSKYVDMNKGVPFTALFIRRVFKIISPVYWGELIQNTVLNCHPNKVSEDHVAIDGKTLRGSKCSSKDIRAIQMVHAWSVKQLQYLQNIFSLNWKFIAHENAVI